MDDSPELFLLYSPLWGATFDSEEIGFIGNGSMVYIPYANEWKKIQKSDVWMERWGHNAYNQEGPELPPCLVVGELPQADEDFSTIFNRLSKAMISDANDAILTLRLFKAGWFLEPYLSEQVFSYSSINTRRVGPYRQAFMDGIPSNVSNGYKLQFADFATKQGEETPMTRMWQLVRQYRKVGRHSSADIAIENFNRSYGYQLGGSQRVSYMFIALDAIFGGMSTGRIGPISLKDSFPKRVTTALGIIRGHHHDLTLELEEEVNWLDTQGRDIRNAIAHGTPSSVSYESEQSYERIQAILRPLLRQYLAFSVNWATNQKEIAEQLDLIFEYPPSAVYNLLLEAHARGRLVVGEFLDIAS